MRDSLARATGMFPAEARGGVTMSDKKQPTALTNKQIVGMAVAVVVLIGLVLWGTNNTSAANAKVISNGSLPARSEYQSQAQALNYTGAAAGEYDRGQMVRFRAKLGNVLEEPAAGAMNVVADVLSTDASGPSSVKEKKIVLVFTESDSVDEAAVLTVRGRYIGSLSYRTAIGAEHVVPAIQVDYIDG